MPAPCRALFGEASCCAFQRVGASCTRVVNVPWDLGENSDGVEGDGVENAGFVVVPDEDAAAWKDVEEGIEVVGVGALQPVHCDYWAGLREQLDGWLRWAVGTCFAADDEHGSVGHHHGAGVPAPFLEADLRGVFLPVVHAWFAWRAVRPVESNSELREN